MQETLADLERFMNEPPRLPVLIRCALLHYQFETIHPFLDGNGRLGRLLIILFLIEQGILEQPLLYVSPYMESSRRQYYERLQAVRERGEIQEWLQYFLTAVTKQAEDAQERARSLVDLRERYRTELAGTRSRASEVVDLAMANPFLTVRRVERPLGVTNQGARLLIRGLQDRGWLNPMGSVGRGGGRVYWLAHEVFSIISGALESERSGSNGASSEDQDTRTRA
jgi:Fic family protein